ncbi:MAG TPA: prepilin-type N-terminal cleavage/methylation domain-containing protein [Bryobacteraceae bacterium]|nr:prepilin-type N-terminal cleavage/methylation domain-containing protein [Bryobacteraceae bacterium]
MLHRKQRRGFSLIELLIVIAIILVIITIAVPKYQKTQIFVRETAAMKAIQTIHTMEVQYQSQYGRFATSLAELGPPASGAPSPASADLIGNDLANGVKQGYKFTVAAIPGGYTINANPVVYGSDGTRTFYSDQTMVIRENYGPEPATASSKETGVAASTTTTK